jgi:hypothetical protein
LDEEKVVRSYPSVACAVASRQQGISAEAVEDEEEERKSETAANHIEQNPQA